MNQKGWGRFLLITIYIYMYVCICIYIHIWYMIYIYIIYDIYIYIYISNVSRLHYFLFILYGKCQQIIDWHFKEALDEITAEGGCDVFDGFCQNVFFFAEALPIWEIKFKITNIYKNIIMSLQKKVVRRMN